jgi:hypothetical protein
MSEAQKETPKKAKAQPSGKRSTKSKAAAATGNGATGAYATATNALPKTEDEAIERAAQLTRMDYAKVRKPWAKHLGFIPVTDFDEAVRQARKEAKAKAAAAASAKAGFTIEDDPDGEKKRTDSQRDRLLEVALSSDITFWHDEDDAAFATFVRDGIIARYRVRSDAFKRLLRLLYGVAHPHKIATKTTGFPLPGGVSDAAMNEALPTLEAIAQRGDMRTPAVRVCRDDNGTVWIDLGDATWRLIAIDTNGWRIEDKAVVPLIRAKAMRALPVPVRDPDAPAKWRALLNLNPGAQASKAMVARADASFKLIAAFSLAVLWPSGPYPILAVNGEHGSAKTTACRVVRRVSDPNRVPIRSVPRNPDDLFVTAKNSRLVVLDNISRLTPELSDVLCGIATGSGKGARQLYTDDEEAILGACNPIILNGIEELLTRGDLADRSLSVMLTAITDDDRRDEAEMEAAIADAAPGILALLLDGMVEAMQSLPTLTLPKLPRMADFTRLACAAAPAFGWTADEMFEAIIENREAAIQAVLAADLVATALLEFLAECTPDLAGYLWVGTATELLKLLRARVDPDAVKSKGWPKTAHHLSGRLKRALPALRRSGFVVTTGRDNKKRGIAIKHIHAEGGSGERVGETASQASLTSSGNLFNELEATLTTGEASPAASPASPGTDEANPAVTLNEAGNRTASPEASPENGGQGTDNVGEIRFCDGDDANDAELPLPSSLPSDDEGLFGDDEGEL